MVGRAFAHRSNNEEKGDLETLGSRHFVAFPLLTIDLLPLFLTHDGRRSLSDGVLVLVDLTLLSTL